MNSFEGFTGYKRQSPFVSGLLSSLFACFDDFFTIYGKKTSFVN